MCFLHKTGKQEIQTRKKANVHRTWSLSKLELEWSRKTENQREKTSDNRMAASLSFHSFHPRIWSSSSVPFMSPGLDFPDTKDSRVSKYRWTVQGERIWTVFSIPYRLSFTFVWQPFLSVWEIVSWVLIGKNWLSISHVIQGSIFFFLETAFLVLVTLGKSFQRNSLLLSSLCLLWSHKSFPEFDHHPETRIVLYFLSSTRIFLSLSCRKQRKHTDRKVQKSMECK